MAKNQIKTKSIEEALWESANKLRGSVEPSEYKHVVLSLIFLKYADDRFVERREELIADGKGAFVDQAVFYNAKNVFFLGETSRWTGYDVPPTSNANYAWILNIVSKLSADGTAGFLLANGALSGDGTELAIRRRLLENRLVEAIVILPRNMFYSTDISVTLWILAGNRKARTVVQNGETVKYRSRENEVLFVDLRQWGEPFEKKYIRFSPEDISRIAENFHNWQREGHEKTYKNVPEYCYSATLEEIEAKGWSLVPSKYIEFVNRDESVDFDTKMRELQAEMSELLAEEARSREEVLSLFKNLGYEIKL